MSIGVDPAEKRPISGQVTGVTGTPAGLPDLEATRFILRPLPGNRDTIFVGAGTGSLTASNGFPLPSGSDAVYLEGQDNLNRLSLLVSVGGDGLGFLALYDPKSNPLT